MFHYIRNNVFVAVGFFLVSLLLESLGAPSSKYVAYAIVVLFLIGFYVASFLALQSRTYKAMLISFLSALLWTVLSIAVTIGIVISIFKFPLH